MEGNNGYGVANLSPAEAVALMARKSCAANSQNAVDPKQIILGVISACSVMLFILLTCVLIAYLSMAALNAF